MKKGGEFLLILSRYITYILVFISSVMTMENTADIPFLALFFILVLINSSFRINKLGEQKLKFIISVVIEVFIIAYMQWCLNGLSFIYFYIIAVDVFLVLEHKESSIIGVALYIAVMVSFIIGSGEVDLRNLLINGVINAGIMIFFAGASYMMRFELKRREKMEALNVQLEASKSELEEANFKLDEYARKIEDIAVLNERNRMAGEIHDTIGHSLTALIMEIDICSKLLDRDVDKAKEELSKASDLARNALSEVRRSVRAIKPQYFENLTGIKAIEELVREFQKNTGIIIKLNVSKNQYKLSPTVEVTIYRTIQEALTNCAKYGQTDIIKIDIRYCEGNVELAIADNGIGCKELTKGVGLRTMEERVHAIGGSIRFSGKNGFYINATIPVEVV